MNEITTRAALDQALLAIAAIEDADYDRAHACTDLSVALHSFGQENDQRRPGFRSITGDVVHEWHNEIMMLDNKAPAFPPPGPLPDRPVPPRPPRPA